MPSLHRLGRGLQGYLQFCYFAFLRERDISARFSMSPWSSDYIIREKWDIGGQKLILPTSISYLQLLRLGV